MKIQVIPIVIALALAGHVAHAGTPSEVDATFGPDAGHYRFNKANHGESVYDSTIDSQGRILLAFLMEDSAQASVYHPAVIRLLADGYIDPSFGFLGLWTDTNVEAVATATTTIAIAVDSSDRPIVGWTFEFDQMGIPNRDWMMKRLTSAGLTDVTKTIAFDLGIGGSGDRLDELLDLRVLTDGRVVLAGGAQYSGVDWDYAVAVLKADGLGGLVLDTGFDGDGRRSVSFDLGGSDYDTASVVAVDTVGLILAGWSNSASGNQLTVCRLDLTDGTFDPTFDTDGKAAYPYAPLIGGARPVRAVDAWPLVSGGLVLAAVVTDSGFDSMAALKIESSGAVVPSFGSLGWLRRVPTYPGLPFDTASSRATGITIDGSRVVISGTISDPLDAGQSLGVVLVTDANGADDVTFSSDGFEYYSFEPAGEQVGTGFGAVHVVTDGKAILTGSMRGITSGTVRNDVDVLATRIFLTDTETGLIFADGFESGGTSAW